MKKSVNKLVRNTPTEARRKNPWNVHRSVEKSETFESQRALNYDVLVIPYFSMGTQSPVDSLCWRVCCSEAHAEVSVLYQSTVPGRDCLKQSALPPDVSVLQHLCWPWNCLFYSSLCFPWSCLFYSSLTYRSLCCPWKCLSNSLWYPGRLCPRAANVTPVPVLNFISVSCSVNLSCATINVYLFL